MQPLSFELSGGTIGADRSNLTETYQTTAVSADGKAGSQGAGAPPSCTVSWINLVGAAHLVAATLVLTRFDLPVITVVLITLTVPALTIVILENLFVNSRTQFSPVRPNGYFAAPTGLPASQRVILKIIGLAASVGALAAIYWLFPIYRDGGAKDLFALAKRLLLPVLVLAPLYVWYVDKKSKTPEDGYFHLGLMIIGSWRLADRDLVRQHCLQWLVKAFFLPRCWYVCRPNGLAIATSSRSRSRALPGRTERSELAALPSVPLRAYLFVIDVGLGCIGYALTLKLLDLEVRSAEPTLLGWVVCVMCYAPFWGLTGQQYLKYGGTNRWEAWLADWAAMECLVAPYCRSWVYLCGPLFNRHPLFESDASRHYYK